MASELQVLPPATGGALTRLSASQEEIDVQVSTAKRYPRSIERFLQTATQMALIDEETAASCFYTLPRDGKQISGPSVRLAEIVATAYGHLRVQGTVSSEDERFLVLRGTTWDMENNLLVSVDVRRRITRKDGSRYSDDMIATTANAGISIAIRNSLFRVIPHTYTNAVLAKCREVARGTAATLSSRREKAIDWFEKNGVQRARIYAALGVRGIEDVTLEHLEYLTGLRTAIREGEITAEAAFSESAPVKDDPLSSLQRDLGCDEATAREITAAWDALKVPFAGRLIQAKKFQGRVGELVEFLTSMGATFGGPEQKPQQTPQQTPQQPAQSEIAVEAEPEATVEAKPVQKPVAKRAGKSAKFGF